MSQLDDGLATGTEEVTAAVIDHTTPADGSAERPTDGSGDRSTSDRTESGRASTGGAATPAGRTAGAGTRSRSQQRREWRQVEKARRYAARKSVRFPIFTRAILLWLFIFALLGLSFGASGAFWWAHFNTQVSQLRDDTRDFEQREQGAAAAIDSQRNQALTQINEAIKPLSAQLAEASTVKLAEQFSPSVWFVDTQDDEGQPSAGTAFALVSDQGETLMLTSFAVVRASSVNPGPPIKVRKGVEEVQAELWNWDESLDLALLRVPRGAIPIMEWASDDYQGKALGSAVFVVGGYGGAGAALSPGLVNDLSAAGFQHNASIGAAYRGGPIVTPDAKVVGVASLDYQPGGFDPGEIHVSIPISKVCDAILSCGGGAKARGQQSQKSTPTTTAPPR